MDMHDARARHEWDLAASISYTIHAIVGGQQSPADFHPMRKHERAGITMAQLDALFGQMARNQGGTRETRTGIDAPRDGRR